LWVAVTGLAFSLVAVAGAVWAVTRTPDAGLDRRQEPEAESRTEPPRNPGSKPARKPAGKSGPKAGDPLTVTLLPLDVKPLPDALKTSRPGAGGQVYGTQLRATLERQLARQAGMQVVPCAAANVKGMSPKDVASRLNVRLVLRGTVEFLADNKLVTVLELLDGSTGTLVWSAEYRETASHDWPLPLYLPIQEKIARDVTERLPLRLLRGERALRHVAVLPYLPGPGVQAAALNQHCDLVTRNLATALSRDRHLQVVSPTGIARLKPGSVDSGPEAAWSEARRTGKRLGVDVIVEVTSREMPNMWHTHVELVEVETGAVIWAETFETHVTFSGTPVLWPEMVAPLAARIPALLAGK
jgi:TolB-like protein